jgi:sugar lactone lactonase YvrE
VSDLDRLVAIDIEAGSVSGEWRAEGAFFNGVAVDGDGRVFVADTLGQRIYTLDGDALSVRLEDEGLHHPDGLAVADGRLLVAPWGQDIQPDLSTRVPGEVLAVGPTGRRSKRSGPAQAGTSTGSSRTAQSAGW